MVSQWGAGNFITISALAINVYTAYKDDIDDQGYISSEVAALRTLINKAAQHFKTTPRGSDSRPHGQSVLIHCQRVLENLDSFARRYNSLPSTTKRQVILSKREIVALRESLISNTILLNGFVRRFVMLAARDSTLFNPMDVNILIVVLSTRTSKPI